jgi:serine/threonine protein kinase
MGEKVHRNSLKSGHKLHWYQIEKILGQGGFGITYLAYDSNLHKNVAIKEYLPIELAVREGDYSVQPVSEDRGEQFQWGLDRFLNEARTLAQFDHPNIVRVHAVFEDNNTGYMVMNFEQGTSLGEKLKGRKTLEEAELIKYLIPIMGGLEQMHGAGFIHRDIKPDNIFIRTDGSPVLLDFGSARQALGGQTRTLTSLVTPGYAPFEQYYSKSNEQGPWTDIYGLGATLYRATTGVAPMDAVDRSNALLKRRNDTFIPSIEFGKGKYSERFLKAIDHALKFNIEDRPQNIAAWHKEFDLPAAPLQSARTESIPTQPGTAFQKPQPMPIPARAKTPEDTPPQRTLFKAGRTVNVVLTLLVLSGVGWLYRDNLQNYIDHWQQGGRIEALLEDARADLAAQRFNNPPGNNALENYREVLALEPANAHAQLGLQTITDHLVNKAQQSVTAGDFAVAKKYLAEAMEILPDAANIKLVRSELTQQRAAKEQATVEAKAKAEKLQAALRLARAGAEKGDVQTTLARLEQARSLGAEESSMTGIKDQLTSALKAQIAAATSEAKTALKEKNTVRARTSLQRAKELKMQLDAL